jgi:hypothetical protein
MQQVRLGGVLLGEGQFAISDGADVAHAISLQRNRTGTQALETEFVPRFGRELHAMAFKDLCTRPTQLCSVLLQAPLNGHIITQLFSAKAGSIARTSLLLLWCSEMATLCRCKR